MKIGFVAGSIWNDHQVPALDGGIHLVVRFVDSELQPTEEYAVCSDAVGAGPGEWVITVGGSSARMTEKTREAAADHTIVGIVDRIDRSAS